MTDSYKFIESSKSRQGDALVCLNNSSESLLLAAATFTGSTDDLYAYATLSCNCFSDVRGTLQIQQSSNGTNWDHTKSFPLTPNYSEIHAVTIAARYVRVNYINGAADQTVFRLQTIAHMHKSVDTNLMGNQAVIDEDVDTQLIRNISDLDYDLIKGKFVSRSLVTVFGYGFEIKTGIREMVRDESAGLADHVFLTTAATLRVKSGGNVNDAAAGTGARSILVKGMDGNFDPIEETIVLNGALVSTATTATFLRVFSAEVSDCGTYGGSNTGIVDVETAAGVLQCRIRAGNGRSFKSLFTIPAGKTAYLRSLRTSVPSDKLGTGDLMVRKADITTAPFAPVKSAYRFQVQGTSADEGSMHYAVTIPEKHDVWISAISNSATIANFGAEYELLLVNNVV